MICTSWCNYPEIPCKSLLFNYFGWDQCKIMAVLVVIRTLRAPAAPATCVAHRESEMRYKLCTFSLFLICTGLWLFFFCFSTLKIKAVGSLKRDRWENSNNSDSESCFWCLNYPEKVKWSSVVSTLGAMMNDDSVCVWECVLQRQHKGREREFGRRKRERERIPSWTTVCVSVAVPPAGFTLFFGLISESHHDWLFFFFFLIAISDLQQLTFK